MRKAFAGTIVLLPAFSFLAYGQAREQLPSGVRPLRYDLALVPDAEKLTFSGRVQIEIAVGAPVSSVVLNADDLAFDKVLLDNKRTAKVALDPKLQRATFAFDAPIAPGNHALAIDYQGTIGKSTLGFFAMDYDSPFGKRRTLATNFEPASERRFMPSWDEPGDKAVFHLTVDIPAGRMAVSNMPVVSTKALGNGRKRVQFAPTPKMSTYLYFLGIGDFERITEKSDGTEVGVVVNRGDTEKARYALSEAARILHYYNGYFGVRYPLPKLDLIVAPGQIQGGSMENWGAIFYSQNHLLFDPKLSTDADRRLVFIVVAHEMSHQWFGDLVTMSWWDNLWLNEGFARWMQNKITFDLHPEWKTNLRALAIAEQGKQADAKPSTHPIVQTVLTAAQAELAFDSITYDKGAAVIRMLEAYAGPDHFKEAVERYMRAHAYGNTVDADFWREVQAASGKPILQMEADFTTQAGVPLLKVNDGNKDELVLTEARFAEDPETIASLPPQHWHIPVTLAAGGGTKTYLLEGEGGMKIGRSGGGPIVVNSGQSAYVRTLYPEEMIRALSVNSGSLDAADQIGILYDSWALGETGNQPVTDCLDFARSMPVTAEPMVWQEIVRMLGEIDALYSRASGRAAFDTFAIRELRPLADKLGWEPKSGEDSNTTNLRRSVLEALSRFGDEDVIREARRRFDTAMNRNDGVSPETRRVVIAIVAHNADATTVDRLITAVRASKDPLERQNFFTALADVSDPAQAERVIDFAIGPDAPAGSAPYILGNIAANHPDVVWKKALEYVGRPDAPIDSSLKLTLMPAIASNSSDPGRIDDLENYAEKNIPATARQAVISAIATIKLHVKFRSERLPEINEWLNQLL